MAGFLDQELDKLTWPLAVNSCYLIFWCVLKYQFYFIHYGQKNYADIWTYSLIWPITFTIFEWDQILAANFRSAHHYKFSTLMYEQKWVVGLFTPRHFTPGQFTLRHFTPHFCVANPLYLDAVKYLHISTGTTLCPGTLFACSQPDIGTYVHVKLIHRLY